MTKPKTWKQFVKSFWLKVDMTGDCWLWKSKSHSGSLDYGSVKLPKCLGGKLGGKMRLAHRVSFFLTHGRWPATTRHTCDTPLCVNPDHLIEGTPHDNMQDCIARGRARNGNIKLNPMIWQAIRESCESNAILAARYGVHPAHVRKIKRGITGLFYRP